MNKDKKEFLKELKKDIETLTPYKNDYTMSDILAIKQVFNDLVINNKADSFYYSVKRFFSKKRYSDFIIVLESNTGFYRVTF